MREIAEGDLPAGFGDSADVLTLPQPAIPSTTARTARPRRALRCIFTVLPHHLSPAGHAGIQLLSCSSHEIVRLTSNDSIRPPTRAETWNIHLPEVSSA